MAVPSTFSELSTTPGSNSGLISDSTAVNQIDNHTQTLYAFVASIATNSGNGWTSPYLAAANPVYTGTLTGGTGIVNLGSGQFYKDASGNVGVGIASPAARLHVFAASNKWATFESDLVAASFMQFTQGGSALALGFFGSDGGGAVSGGSGANLAIRAENDLLLASGANNVRMRIDASGNVTIANTASAPTTPGSGGVLYVEAGALKFRGSSGSITILAPA